MRTIRVIAIFAAFLFVAKIAMAADYYYVRSGATGANNGTDWTNAYTSLPGTLVRGATYYIAAGAYGSHTFKDAETASTFIYIKKATTMDHGPATDWQSSYDTGQATFSGWTFNAGYYDINGQTGGGPYSWDTGFGIVVTSTKGKRIIFNKGVSHVTISHTEVTNSDNKANDVNFGSLIYAYGNVTYITLSYTKIHHVFGCCIQTGYVGADNWIVEYSKVGDNTGTSSNHSEIWSMNGSDNWTWRYNYIYAWRSTGAIYGTGPGVNGTGDANLEENYYIYGNIFDQAGTSSSWLIAAHADGSYDYHYARGWRVYNNTFININSVSVGVYACALDTTGVGDNEFKNNIFYGNTDIMQVYGATEDYNSYQGSSQFLKGPHDTLLNSSPFVNYSGGDYRLTSASPGVLLSPEYNTDMYGNTRGEDGVWDRGAYEYNSSTLQTRPAAPTNLTIN